MSFWLYLNKKPTYKADTLEEAKKLAESHINDKQPLIIERIGESARKLPLSEYLRWKYDYEKNIWVEEVINFNPCGIEI